MSPGRQNKATPRERYQLASFPYFPPHIRPQDLGVNGKILSDEEIAALHEVLDGEEDGHYLRTKLHDLLAAENTGVDYARYSIIKINGRLYASYDSQHVNLGRGAFGSANYAMDLETGEWHVVKKMQEAKHTTKDSVRQETHLIAKTSNSPTTGYIYKEDATSKTHSTPHNQFMIVMDFARGTRLDQALQHIDRKPNAYARRLDYAIGCLEAVMEAHQKGILHRDIKLENFIVDELTGKVKLIDWGLAVETTPPDLTYDSPRGTAGAGTQGFRANEVLNGHYSIKSDSFALAKTLSLLFGIAEDVFEDSLKKHPNDSAAFKQYYDQQCDLLGENIIAIKSPRKIARELGNDHPHYKMLATISNKLGQMTKRDPHLREGLDECLAVLKELREQHLDALTRHRHVFFLEITDHTSYEEIAQLVKNNPLLREHDEIILTTATTHPASSVRAARIRQHLEAEGLLVQNSLLRYSPNYRAEAIHQFIQHREKNDGLIYTWESCNDLEFKNKIIKNLDAQLTRLQKNYGTTAKESIFLIKQVMFDLKKMGTGRADILNHLQAIEQKLKDNFFKDNRFREFLRKYFNYQPEALKAVTQLKQTAERTLSNTDYQAYVSPKRKR